MNDLELCKKFAELEGVEWRVDKVDGKAQVSTLKRWKEGDLNNCCWVEFNPITGLALNCAARDKYEVEVDYYMTKRAVTFRRNGIFYVSFTSKEEIPRAVIECILESEGKL